MTHQIHDDDILERTYRRAAEQADALGCTIADLGLVPSTAVAIEEYAERIYGVSLDQVPSWNVRKSK